MLTKVFIEYNPKFHISNSPTNKCFKFNSINSLIFPEKNINNIYHLDIKYIQIALDLSNETNEFSSFKHYLYSGNPLLFSFDSPVF